MLLLERDLNPTSNRIKLNLQQTAKGKRFKHWDNIYIQRKSKTRIKKLIYFLSAKSASCTSVLTLLLYPFISYRFLCSKPENFPAEKIVWINKCMDIIVKFFGNLPDSTESNMKLLTSLRRNQLVRIIWHHKIIPFKCVNLVKSYFMILDGIVGLYEVSKKRR